MERRRLEKKAAKVPAQPGVYLFKNREGAVIYVGQSANLNRRIAAYLQTQSRRSPRINQLVAEIADLAFVTTTTPLNAMKLERQLIKKHRPRYNRTRLSPESVVERQKQILDAAVQVFAREGFDRATIAEIAATAGVSEGTIYNYFKNKGDLLISIPRQALQLPVEAVTAQMRNATGAPIPPEQILPVIAKNMVAVIRQNGHIFRILISTLPTMNQATREQYLNRVLLYVWDILEAYFKELIEKGVFRRDLNPAILTRAFVGMLLPFILLDQILRVNNPMALDDDQVVAQVVAVFLRGALADPRERKSR